MKRLRLAPFGAAVLLLCGAVCLRAQDKDVAPPGATEKQAASTPARQESSATKRARATPIEKPGLPNLHRVSDDLYRGAQPTAEGIRQLKAMGIRTVINQRSLHSDRDEIGKTALAYEHIPMETWDPEGKDVVRFLKLVADKDRTPVFVHCQHGADRTGTMCAIYRMAVQGWTKEEAIDEMTNGGFGFHKIWQNLVRYVRNLDVEHIKKQAGLSKPAPP